MIAIASKPIRKRRSERARRPRRTGSVHTEPFIYADFSPRVQYGPNLYAGYYARVMRTDPSGTAAGEFKFEEKELEKKDVHYLSKKQQEGGGFSYMFGVTGGFKVEPLARCKHCKCNTCGSEPATTSHYEGEAGLLMGVGKYAIATKGLTAALVEALVVAEKEHYNLFKKLYDDSVPLFKAHHKKQYANKPACDKAAKAVLDKFRALAEDWYKKHRGLDAPNGLHEQLAQKVIIELNLP